MAIWSFAIAVDVYNAIINAPSIVSINDIPAAEVRSHSNGLSDNITSKKEGKYQNQPNACAFNSLN